MPYFQAFQPVSVTVTFFMNSITFVMNHLFSYFDISICHSSNRTLSYRLLLTHGFNHGYILGGPRYIHLTKETNAVFSRFSHLLGYGCHIYESNHFRDEFPLYLTLTSSSIPVGIEFRFTTSVFSLGLTMIKP